MACIFLFHISPAWLRVSKDGQSLYSMQRAAHQAELSM